MKRFRPKNILCAAAILLLMACSSVDCQMVGKITANYELAGDITTLTDTLTVYTTRADESDTILLNKLTSASSFSLPVSNSNPTDTLCFLFASETGFAIDTVIVSKIDQSSFKALDCTPIFTHIVMQVESSHHVIDSIVINNRNIAYGNDQSHFLVYLKSNAY